MAAANKFNQFSEDLSKAVHNLSSNALTLAMTTLANKPVVTNSILANLTQISYTNLSARTLSITSCVQTSGLLKLICADKVLTASGTVAAFGTVVLWNDTPTSPADPLICWWEFASDLTLNNTDTLTVDFDDTNGVLQIQ